MENKIDCLENGTSGIRKDLRFQEEPLFKCPNEPTPLPRKDLEEDFIKKGTKNTEESKKTRVTSNRQFEIYKDAPEEENSGSIVCGLFQESFLNGKTKIDSSKTQKKLNKYRGLRMISDTVLSKKNFSSDNEISTTKIAELNTSSHLPENVGRNQSQKYRTSINANLSGITSQKVKIPLKRRPLALISPLTDSGDRLVTNKGFNSNTESKSPSSDEENSDQDFENSSDKENIYPDLEFKDPPIGSNHSVVQSLGCEDYSPKYGDIFLFTPQHYWNLTFERKQLGNSISLEDFHLLLYDYERLWNRYVEDGPKRPVT